MTNKPLKKQHYVFYGCKIKTICPMMREVSLETLPNVNIRDPNHDKNLPIMSVTGSINQNVFKYF